MTLRILRLLAQTLLLAIGMQADCGISVCLKRHSKPSPEVAVVTATLNVAGDKSAGNWNLAGLHCPHGMEL